MTVTTPTPTSPIQDCFLIPKRIIKDGRLRMLSGDALALYIWIAHSLYRRRKQACLYANSDLARTLDMTPDVIREARQELRAHRLIGYKSFKNGFLYWFAPTPQTTLSLAVTKPHD